MKYVAIVPGEPVPQGRPRFSVRNNHVRAHDPRKNVNYKAYIQLIAAESKPDAPVVVPVRLGLKIYRSIPKSWSKKRKASADAGQIRPTTKPDISNVLKGVEDALNGIWYHDDSQIVEYGEIGKWYSTCPRIEIEMETIENGGSENEKNG